MKIKKFNSNDGVKENVLNWRHQDKDFFVAGINKLIKRWDKCINVVRDYVEKQKEILSRLNCFTSKAICIFNY